MSEAILCADRISVRLGGAPVLRDVSLSVAAGEVLGVFGPSGAGKSTLFRALAGELRPTSGRVLLGAEDVTPLLLWQRARRGLGYLPQAPSVLWDLTVAENIAVFQALSPRGARQDMDAVVAGLGLAGRRSVLAGSLSFGERRRLDLCRALSALPRALLCDEPFAAIDPIGKGAVAAELRALAEAGCAVVIADHHVAEALGLCDRAALLLEGEIALVARPDAFARDSRVLKHYAPPAPAP